MTVDFNYQITDIKVKYEILNYHLIWSFGPGTKQKIPGAFLLCRLVKRVLYFLESIHSKIDKLKNDSIAFKNEFPENTEEDVVLSLGEQGFKYEIEAYIVFVESLLCKKSSNKIFSEIDKNNSDYIIGKFQKTFDSIEVIINKLRNDIIHINQEFVDHYNLPSEFSFKTDEVITYALSSRDGLSGNLISDFYRITEAILPILDEAANVFLKYLTSTMSVETHKMHIQNWLPYRAIGKYSQTEGFIIKIFKPPYNDEV